MFYFIIYLFSLWCCDSTIQLSWFCVLSLFFLFALTLFVLAWFEQLPEVQELRPQVQFSVIHNTMISTSFSHLLSGLGCEDTNALHTGSNTCLQACDGVLEHQALLRVLDPKDLHRLLIGLGGRFRFSAVFGKDDRVEVLGHCGERRGEETRSVKQDLKGGQRKQTRWNGLTSDGIQDDFRVQLRCVSHGCIQRKVTGARHEEIRRAARGLTPNTKDRCFPHQQSSRHASWRTPESRRGLEEV